MLAIVNGSHGFFTSNCSHEGLLKHTFIFVHNDKRYPRRFFTNSMEEFCARHRVVPKYLLNHDAANNYVNHADESTDPNFQVQTVVVVEFESA